MIKNTNQGMTSGTDDVDNSTNGEVASRDVASAIRVSMSSLEDDFDNKNNVFEDEQFDETDGDDELKLEIYESWGAPEHIPFSFKPLALTALVLLISGIGVVAYFFYNDPAAVWDRVSDNPSGDNPSGAKAKNAGELWTAGAAATVPEQSVRTSVGSSRDVEVEPIPVAPESITHIPETVLKVEVPSIVSANPTPADSSSESDLHEPEPSKPVSNASSSAQSASTPTAPTATGSPPTDYDELLASAMAMRGRKSKITTLRSAIVANPSGDEARAELAVLLMDRRTTRAEALELAKEASRINPDNGAAWLVIGYIHQLNGRGINSRDAYRRCAKASGPKIYVEECRRME